MFKNLGIFFKDNIPVNNSDLEQGQMFITYEHDVTTKVFERLPYLQITSMPGLYSINEALNGDDSILASNKNITDNISENELGFNKILSEYSTLQKSLESSNLFNMNNSNSNNNSNNNNKDIMNKLSELNNKLVSHAKIISSEISNLKVDDESLKRNINEQQTHLNNYINTLEEQKRELPHVKDINTVNGMKENSGLIRKSNKYYYLMWFIVFITLLSLFMYILTSDLVQNTLIVIICLMIIYILARAIHNKYV